MIKKSESSNGYLDPDTSAELEFDTSINTAWEEWKENANTSIKDFKCWLCYAVINWEPVEQWEYGHE